jgi:hypothetical protein
VRTIRNTQIYSVGIMESFSVLQQAVYSHWWTFIRVTVVHRIFKSATGDTVPSGAVSTLAAFAADIHSSLLFAICLHVFISSCHKSFSAFASHLNLGSPIFLPRSVLWGLRFSQSPSACYLSNTGFFSGLFFDPEDGGEIFLRNVSWISTDYTTLYPGRKN